MKRAECKLTFGSFFRKKVCVLSKNIEFST